jgi:hypothetical protein
MIESGARLRKPNIDDESIYLQSALAPVHLTAWLDRLAIFDRPPLHPEPVEGWRGGLGGEEDNRERGRKMRFYATM